MCVSTDRLLANGGGETRSLCISTHRGVQLHQALQEEEDARDVLHL